MKQQGYEVVRHADIIRSGIVTQQNKRVHDKRNQAAARARRKRDVTTDVSADVTGDAVSQSDKQHLEGDPEQRWRAAWDDVTIQDVPS